MSLRPRFDDAKSKQAVAFLMTQPAFRALVTHQQALLDYTKEQLISAAPADVQRLQGAAAQLREFIDLTKE